VQRRNRFLRHWLSNVSMSAFGLASGASSSEEGFSWLAEQTLTIFLSVDWGEDGNGLATSRSVNFCRQCVDYCSLTPNRSPIDHQQSANAKSLPSVRKGTVYAARLHICLSVIRRDIPQSPFAPPWRARKVEGLRNTAHMLRHFYDPKPHGQRFASREWPRRSSS
jgi:hypothetical protein